MEVINETQDFKKNNYLTLILYFFIFSFLGWILESLFSFLNLGFFVKRGFLYGPICPIYGFGAIILIRFLSIYKKNTFELFLYSVIIFSFFEYLVGFALEALFAKKWWNYSNEFLNLNTRISILFSLAWGIISIIFINHIFPFIQTYINRFWNNIFLNYKKIIIYTLILIFIIDMIFSIIKYL